MLKKEYEFFLTHQDVLLEKYRGKFIAIAGDQVVTVADSLGEVIVKTIPDYPVGSFLVQEISEDEFTQIQRFRSRVYV